MRDFDCKSILIRSKFKKAERHHERAYEGLLIKMRIHFNN